MWDEFCRMLREQFRLEDYGRCGRGRAGDNAATEQREHGELRLQVLCHVFEDSRPVGGGEDGQVRSPH